MEYYISMQYVGLYFRIGYANNIFVSIISKLKLTTFSTVMLLGWVAFRSLQTLNTDTHLPFLIFPRLNILTKIFRVIRFVVGYFRTIFYFVDVAKNSSHVQPTSPLVFSLLLTYCTCPLN